MGLLTYNALLFATELVLPVSMEPMALTGARQTLDGVEQIRSLWPDHPLELVAVVPTSVNSATYASKATLEALTNDARMREPLFPGGIRQCIDLTYAMAAGQTIWEYAPQSRAAADYTALLNRLIGAADDTRPAYGQIEKAQTIV
jgi:chromosome partitioning protein